MRMDVFTLCSLYLFQYTIEVFLSQASAPQLL